MANIKTFEESEILGTALGVFIKHGYSGTSISELKKASRLSAGSLYFAFKNKQELFLRVLDYYVEQVVLGRIQQHIHDRGFFEGVRSYFESTFTDKRLRDGCLLTITSADSRMDEAIFRRVTKGFEIIERKFIEIVKRAQQDGEIDPQSDPLLIAQHLFTTYQGLLVLVRFGKSNRYLKAATDAALACIPSL